ELDGRIADQWLDLFGGEHDLALTATEAGGLARGIAGDLAIGDGLDVRLEVKGPALVPRVRLTLEEFALAAPVGGGGATSCGRSAEARTPGPAPPPFELEVDRAVAELDLATESGQLHEPRVRAAGGELRVAAR